MDIRISIPTHKPLDVQIGDEIVVKWQGLEFRAHIDAIRKGHTHGGYYLDTTLFVEEPTYEAVKR